MSDYKRLVSYIYGYEQGEKRESTGFVKVNARGGSCRISVHMKGFYTRNQQPYQVYIFTQKRDRLQGIFLGELESRNGALEWNGVTETDSLMGGNFGLEESRGIYIQGEDRIFAADWDDFPVDVDRFEPVRRFARQDPVEKTLEENFKQEGKKRQLQLVKTEDQKATVDVEKEKIEAAEVDTVETTKQQPIDTKQQSLETLAETEERTTVKRTVETVSEKPGFQDLRWSQWEYLVNHFPVMRYVEGDTVVSSIRLGARDMARVPRDKWGRGNNSFLLHGLYQYHHILLVRRQEESKVRYQIGVPGIYNNQEQMMAAMFGFQEFKVMKENPGKGRGFGYWCRTLE